MNIVPYDNFLIVFIPSGELRPKASILGVGWTSLANNLAIPTSIVMLETGSRRVTVPRVRYSLDRE
jgi:hypothetical protein